MSETVTTPEATKPAPPRRRWLWPAIGAIIIAGLAWLGLDTRNGINELRGQLATKLAEADTYNKQTQAIAGQARQDTKEALAKLSVLENKLAESQNQQVALEALYQELSRNRDEVSLANLQDILETASQQLQLAGNVKSALIALQSADAQLARDDNKARWVQLRRAINQDLERLKALPYVDTVAISAKLDSLIGGVDNLPLLSEPVITGEPPTPEPNPSGGAFMSRFGKELVANIGQLVRIRNLDKPDVPLLAPSQSYFLRENLKLRLLNARLALLARNEPSYKADLATAGELLATHFDSKIKAVTTAQATLKQLADSPISIAPPDIADSLKAVRAARLSREKATK